MKKSERKIKPRKKILDFPCANLIWGALALCVWFGEQGWHVHKGEVFSLLLFLKGVLILALGALAYYFSDSKGFSFLGLFPLLWLTTSKFQWDLCASGETRYWVWLVLFLSAEIIILKIKDGKWLLAALAPVWTGLALLFPFSFLLPLTFLKARKEQFKRSKLIRWGGLGLGLGLFLLSRGWRSLNFFEAASGGVPIHFWFYFLAMWFFFVSMPLFLLRRNRYSLTGKMSNSMFFNLAIAGPFLLGLAWWLSLHFYFDKIYNLLIPQHFLSFFLLGWLGLIATPKKGTCRFAFSPLFLLTLGFLFWGTFPAQPMEKVLYQWVLVFFAGFGWESFRRDLMDPSWHGRLVWASLGAAFFAGVV